MLNRLHSTLVLITAALLMSSWTASAGEFPDAWFWGKPDQRAKHAALEGKRAPNLDLEDWQNGQPTGKDLKGKIVVVDFWATWCGPCLAAIPKNNKIHEEYGDQGVVVIGVCGSSRGQEKFKQVLEDKNVQYPSARDASGDNAKAWQVMWWPTYGVIDGKGVVRALGLKPGHVEDVVKKLLEEQQAEKDKAASTAAFSDDRLVAKTTEVTPIPAEYLEGDSSARERLADLEGKQPPAMDLSNWLNGSALTAKDVKGKVVVLDFWATWCGPCIRSIPHNNELQAKYADQGLIVLGICHPQGAEKMKQTVKEHGLEYLTAVDADGKTKDAFKVNGFPDYYIIDRSGNLRAADVRNSSVEDVVKLLLAEPAPDDAVATID